MSDELGRLASLLLDLEALLSVISDLANEDRLKHVPQPLPILQRSLQRCKQDLQPLEELEHKLGNRGAEGKIDKMRLAFKVVALKKYIQRMESRVHRSLHVLGIALAADARSIG